MAAAMETSDISGTSEENEISVDLDKLLNSDDEESIVLSSTKRCAMDIKHLEQYQDELSKFQRYQELVQNNLEDIDEIKVDINYMDLFTANELKFAKNYVIESTQLSHLVHPTISENRRTPFSEQVENYLKEIAILSMDTAEIEEDIIKAKNTILHLTQKSKTLANKKRELMGDIKQLDIECLPDEPESEEMKELARHGKDRINKAKRKLELISTLGSRMVFASGIDWYESDEIREMLMEFGKPLPQN